MHLRGRLSNPSDDLRDLIAVRQRGLSRSTRPRVHADGEVQILRQPNRKLSQREIDQVVARYRAGETVLGLGVVFHMHESTVRRHLRRQGVTLRGNRRPKYTESL